MLATLLPLISVALMVEDASAYFPTKPGMTWTYSEQGGRSQQVFTDKVGKPLKLVETEVVPKAIDVATYYTNDLIDEINKFDEAAVTRRAREFKP